MILRYVIPAFTFLATACSGGDLPPRYHQLQRMFHETKPHLMAIEREMEKDDLWQLVPYYINSEINEPHLPHLTSGQIAKYRDLLDLVPYVTYVDKVDNWIDFSLGRLTTDQWHFFFQFVHTTQRARPVACDELPIRSKPNVCASDFGDDWGLWVSWIEPSDEVN